jgi:hypothetical protein
LLWDTLTEAVAALSCNEALRHNAEIPLAFGDVEDVFKTILHLGDLRRNMELRELDNPVEGMLVFRLSKCRDDRDRVRALLCCFSHL